MVTNQLVGVVNQLTDGTLYVNGALVFANAQFSLTLPSITASNNVVLTAGSGNTLFLQSSNAVINGTAFISGTGTGLLVSNNATINGKLTVNTVTVTGVNTSLTVSNSMSVGANMNVTNIVNTSNLIVSGNANVIGLLTVGAIQTTGAGSSGSLNVGGSLTVTQNTISNNIIAFQNTAAIYATTPLGQDISQLYIVSANTLTPGNSATWGTMPGPQIMMQEMNAGETVGSLPPGELGLNPAKWIRLNNNIFQILNSGYDTILTLDDAGDFWVSGNIIMNGGSF